MASFRRTLSPAYRDRSQLNGSASSSPSYKFSKYSQAHRKGSLWRKPLYRFIAFFVVGILVGMTPFGHMGTIQNHHDFSFGINLTQNSIRLGQNDAGVSGKFSASAATRVEEDLGEGHAGRYDFVSRKLLIVVTPSYNRGMQAYFLHRLAQVLSLVPPPLLWIVVEENAASMETAEMLRKSGVMYRHLVCQTNTTNIKDRGVHQRNTALEHIEHHKLDGIVYFADDDNVYSLELFDKLRDISRFGTWPVAMLAQSKNKAILEGPVCNGSQVSGWHTNEKSKRVRRFHVDMSGFAFNSTILWNPKRWKRQTPKPIRQLDSVKEGFQETTFIEQIVEDESQMEGIPGSCSKILNWHLHLEARILVYPRGWLLQKNLDCTFPIT